MSLHKKRVLITGAGAGIGRDRALAFAGQGAVVMVSDISADAAERVAAEIAAAGGEGCANTADVTSEADATRVVAQPLRTWVASTA